MRLLKMVFCSVCFSLALLASNASAGEEEKIKVVVKDFYSQDEKALQCRRKDGSVDGNLIRVPERFFSSDFMVHYRSICLGEVAFVFSFDIRTADNSIYLYEDSKASFSDLRVGTPIINGTRAIVMTTYDLDEFSFKDWGNFTKLKMVKQSEGWKVDDIELGGKGEDRESITSLKSIKSLKKYIDENVKKSRLHP
jgi:hypothetical protein